MPTWPCPRCKRRFSRKNQRHACGTGDRAEVLRNRSPELVALYETLEAFVKSIGPVELVTRERYVLFRRARIFADLTVQTDALRLAIHLPQQVGSTLFEKVVADRKHVTHVVRLRDRNGLDAVKPFLLEAYQFAAASKRNA